MLLRQLLGIGAVLLTESSVHPMLSEKDSSEIVFSLRENIPSYLPKEIDPSSMAPRLVVKYFFDANEDGVRNIAEKLFVKEQLLHSLSMGLEALVRIFVSPCTICILGSSLQIRVVIFWKRNLRKW